MSNEIEQMEATIDKNTNALLEASYQIIDLQKENQRLNAQDRLMKLDARRLLSIVEGIFNRDPDQLDRKELYEYLDSAKFHREHFNRQSDYIVAVTLYLKK